MARWIQTLCPRCNGSGLVSVYSANDFEGAGDCPDCASGSIWISQKDRVALYPGGPLRGSWPGEYSRLFAKQLADVRESTSAPKGAEGVTP